MQKTITVTQKSGTRALLSALAAVSLILARRAACSTRKWLCTRHDFMAADGDPIQCTGLQLIGCSLAFLALSFILSIHF